MTPERYQKAGLLYHSALKIEPEQRTAFLDGACGDDEELRREVESLLAAHDKAGDYFATPALEVAAGLIADRAAAMGGQTVSHYRVLSLIGAGGMGEVYLAEDTLLNRRVAIKFLCRTSVADPQAGKRLLREAQSAAKLDHPNICAIYEVAEEGGRCFIVMQYVEGETLASRIHHKPFELPTTLSLAAQIADALSEAHSRGIIHRDIKPQNIMVTARNHAKVMDFGLAKVIRERSLAESEALTESLLTEPGIVIGTVPYMSPEQVQGNVLDARSDIFSFGAVLYEMITGHKPFEERNAAALFSAILSREPMPLNRYAVNVPPELERIVRKCLEKDSERRYQTIRDVAIDLENLRRELAGARVTAAHEQSATAGVSASVTDQNVKRTGKLTSPGALVFYSIAAVLVVTSVLYVLLFQGRAATGGPEIKSLAVLPLENLSGDPAQEYFADGMTDALIGELTKVRALRVTARTSTMRFKGTKRSLPEIARELGVDGVIEGTVQRRGDRVRVRTQLVHAATEQALWSRNWDNDLRDVLSLQSEIAHAIVNEVRIKLTPGEQTRLSSERPVNPEAYQAYLKGRYFTNQGISNPSCREAEELYEQSFRFYEQAIKIDPTYAQAHLGLGVTYHWLASCDESYRNLYHKARASVEQALALDETLAEAHGSLAFILWYFEWDWAGADREFKRAMELGATSGIYHGYGLYLSDTGRHTEAIEMMKRAVELDPLTIVTRANLGNVYLGSRQYDLAIVQFKYVLDLAPNDDSTRLALGTAYVYQRKNDEGLAEIRKVVASPETESVEYSKSRLAWAYAASGNRGQALKLLDHLTAPAQQSPRLKVIIARTHAMLGGRDLAIEWLEKAYQVRANLLSFNSFPEFDSLRSDPRYTELLRKINSRDVK